MVNIFVELALKRTLLFKENCVSKKEGRLPRSRWKLGKIEELIKGDDGAILGAELRISSKGLKEGDQCKLALEVRQVEPVPQNAVVTQPAGDVQRPRREAAVTGRLVDQCWDDDNDL